MLFKDLKAGESFIVAKELTEGKDKVVLWRKNSLSTTALGEAINAVSATGGREMFYDDTEVVQIIDELGPVRSPKKRSGF